MIDRARLKAIHRAASLKWFAPVPPNPAASLLTVQPRRDRVRRIVGNL